MKHTPEPWVVEYKPGYRHYIHGNDHNAICKMSDSRETEEGKANARLIASAPDLLALLKKIDKFGSGLLGKEIEQAIAKAESK